MSEPIRTPTAGLVLRPADGRRVRHPDGRLLLDAGERVAASAHWWRKLAAGDVEIVADRATAPSRRAAARPAPSTTPAAPSSEEPS